MKRLWSKAVATAAAAAMLLATVSGTVPVSAAAARDADVRPGEPGYEMEQLLSGGETDLAEDASFILMDSGRKETGASLIAADGTYVRESVTASAYSNGAEVWRYQGVCRYNEDGRLTSTEDCTYDASGNVIKSTDISYNEDGAITYC